MRSEPDQDRFEVQGGGQGGGQGQEQPEEEMDVNDSVFDRDLERTFPRRADQEKRLKLVEENIDDDGNLNQFNFMIFCL